jgi:hypothetical protein
MRKFSIKVLSSKFVEFVRKFGITALNSKFIGVVLVTCTACGGGGTTDAVTAGSIVPPPVTVNPVPPPVTVNPVPPPVTVNPVQTLSAESYQNAKNLDFFSEDFPRDQYGVNPLRAEAVAFFRYPDGTKGLVASINEYWQNGSMMPLNSASPGRIVFYRKLSSGWQVHEVSVQQQVQPCIHARKVLVADFNKDSVPDFAIMCHGWDAPPYPGERNTILLSQGKGYVLKHMSDQIEFYHGGSTADFNGDGAPDIVTTTMTGLRVYINNGAGSFTASSTYTIPVFRSTFQVELVDLNGDGHFDVIAGGHEDTEATRIVFNPGNNQFNNAKTVTIPTVPGAGVIVDFVYTPANNALYILRTGDGKNNGTEFYHGLWLQKYSLTTGLASVVVAQPDWIDSRFGAYSKWLTWIDEENGYIVSQWGNAFRFKVE